MRKFFLIPLLTLVCSVMAFAQNEAKIGDIEYATLKAAIDAASSGETIELLKDVSYIDLTGSAPLNINKSLTIKGYGHTISGYSWRSGKSQFATIWINLVESSTSNIDVQFDDVRIVNPRNATTKIGKTKYALGTGSDWAIHTRGKIGTITIKDSYLEAYSTALQIGGNQAATANVIASNDTLNARSYYAVVSYNPYNMTISDSYVHGWAALYFKGVDGSAGSRGSVVNATNTEFDCPNLHNGTSNSFGAFVCEDDGITINATNCKINSSAYGDQPQALILASGEKIAKNRRSQPISLTLAGDNTQIIMGGEYFSNIDVKAVQTFNNNTWYYYDLWGYDGYGIVPFSVTMTGGTYDVNPYLYRHVTAVNRDEYGQPIETEDGYSVQAQSPIIPAGYAVVEVQDGGKTRYRIIHSDNISYNINGNYEEEGAGDNPTTSFIVEAESANQTIELVNNNTEAAYVQVRDNADDEAVTLAVGKMDGESKVDQTLVVNNGLDVQGNSQVTVQAGSTLQIGEGGIVTEKPENIVIEADETGAASLLLDPAITVNETPNLTVAMKVSQAGKDAYGDYWWHRFAMPVGGLENAWTKSPNYGTYLYGWNYATNDWEKVEGGSTNMQPWKGYTLTYNEAYNENETVTYTFKGNLVGNQDAALTFEEEGYQFFGNSYTGYMDVLTLINNLTDGNIDQTVWMWNPANQTYSAVPLDKLSDPVKAARLKDWQKEVAPMQTFIMRLRGASSANETVSYADAIWGNPRYGNSVAPAPRRLAVSADEAYMEIVVTAANGQSDRVDFTVNSERSDAFENGFDASKYMNERHINLYATVAGEDYTSVATDNIEGKTISLQTKNDINYTISFENVETAEYAIRDNVTGAVIAIEEGATYEFAAQPNSLVENRFEILPIAKMPTAIENAEVKANAKGIFTLTGQYVGEDFEAVPAGVYVVNGVKIVK